jgi:Coenzyme PQQ synthesis protein D (PqqD)
MSPDPETPLCSRTAVHVPAHVVFRRFPGETVMLNLETGLYYGLNETAAHMLDALHAQDVIEDAAVIVAEHYREDEARVLADLLALCAGLLERGLLVADGDA